VSAAWKDFEDRVCRALGGRRVLGNRGSSIPDSDENVQFSVEAKHGYEKFALRSDWLEQARRNAVSGKPWILVQAPKRSRTPLVTLEFSTFVEIASKAGYIHQTEGADNGEGDSARDTDSRRTDQETDRTVVGEGA
jgi:hypothetical protein